jgi:hypothetical protein
MKKLNFLITILILGISSWGFSQEIAKQSQGDKAIEIKKNGPVADFDKMVCDLGDLVQNSPGTAVFTLTNHGNEPLVISSAKASCGCTNLAYSRDPVLPGKSVTISATYNAAAVGNFMKTVTVKTNAGEQDVILQIKGKVLPKS